MLNKLRGRDLSPDEIDSLVDFYVKHTWIDDAINIADKLGASTKVIDSIIKLCINQGTLDDALKAARLRGGRGSLTTEEIIVKCITP